MAKKYAWHRPDFPVGNHSGSQELHIRLNSPLSGRNDEIIWKNLSSKMLLSYFIWVQIHPHKPQFITKCPLSLKRLRILIDKRSYIKKN